MSAHDDAMRETSTGPWTPDASNRPITPSPSPTASPKSTEPPKSPTANNSARSVSRQRIDGRTISPASPVAAASSSAPTNTPDATSAPEPVTSHPRNHVSLDRLLAQLQQSDLSAEQAEAAQGFADVPGVTRIPQPQHGPRLTPLAQTAAALEVTLLEQQEEAFEEAEAMDADDTPHDTPRDAPRTRRETWEKAWEKAGEKAWETWEELQAFLGGRATYDTPHPEVAAQRRAYERAEAERRTAERMAAQVLPNWLDTETAGNRLGGISRNAVVQLAKRHGFPVWKVKGRNHYREADIEAYAHTVGLHATQANRAPQAA